MIIKRQAKRAICQAVYWCAESVVSTAFRYLRNGKATVTPRELQAAVRLLIPSELANRIITECTKAVTRLQATKMMPPKVHKRRRTPIASQIGLIVSPSLLRPLLDSVFKRVAKSSAVYLATFVEYLMAEILDMSGNVAQSQKKKSSRITPRHVYLAVAGDEELSNLFKRGVFISGGVMPLRQLVPKQKSLPKPKRSTSTRPATLNNENSAAPRRSYRYRPGVVRLREIRKQQKSTDLILSRTPFTRLTREVMQQFKDGQRIGVDALNVLQSGIESYMIDILREANLIALNAKRQTLMPKDLHLVRRIKRDWF